MDEKEKEQPKKAPAPKPAPPPAEVAVKVLKTEGASSLVEWVADGAAQRVFVPAAKVKGGVVAENVLSKGVPYGVPWGDIKLPALDIAAALEKALHNAGIWTAEDLSKNQRAARGAVQAALQLHLGAVNSFAKEKGGT